MIIDVIFSEEYLFIITSTAMAVSMSNISEEEHSKHIDGQSNSTNDHDQLRLVDSLNDQKSLERLHGYGEAESEEEDGVNESPDHLGPGVAEGVPPPLAGRDP